MAGGGQAHSVSLLKARASRQAVAGVMISLGALVIALLLSSYIQFGRVTIDGIVEVQRHNPLLWLLYAMPFAFAVWGQAVGRSVVRHAEDLIHDQTQRFMAHTEHLESKVVHTATHDALTGLPNRVLFREQVESALDEARARGAGLAVFLLDLDRFKEINDTLGHANGDLILKRVAARLDREIEVDEVLARMGGDEFAILMPRIGQEEDVRRLALKLLDGLAKPLLFAGLSLDLRGSIGAAVFPEHGLDADTLMMRADVAMYFAKDEGGGFKEYAPGIDTYSPERLTLMGELRHALDNGGLNLHYQPKVESSSGRVNSAEALVRWHHPRQGLLSPGLFIPMAEKTGVIKEISQWVIKEVVSQIAAWQKEGREVRISVNLSARDLLDAELPRKLAKILHRQGVSPDRLVLEITETAIIADPDLALGILRRLAEMGVGISIDDFGTGYSSLAYLRKMPAGEIKIDRSFVMDMLVNASDATIVQAAISLAHNLGLRVVAEGVENHETAERLRELGCDVLQGFHFGKPVPPGEFISQLGRELHKKVH